jgi:hypothetical protein
MCPFNYYGVTHTTYKVEFPFVLPWNSFAAKGSFPTPHSIMNQMETTHKPELM